MQQHKICSIIFQKTYSVTDDNQLTQYLSAVGLGNKMNLKLRFHLEFFFSFIFNVHFVFSFIILHLIVMLLRTDNMIRIIGSFQIPFFGSFSHVECPENTTEFAKIRNFCCRLRFKIIIINLCKSTHAEFYSQRRCY